MDIAAKNSLVLAFVGDAFFTLYVREKLTRSSNAKANALHISASKYVSAVAQAKMLEKIAPYLDETETGVAGRARNAENFTRPKNCTLAQYKHATAFEAVLGYNYLAGNTERLENLLKIATEEANNK